MEGGLGVEKMRFDLLFQEKKVCQDISMGTVCRFYRAKYLRVHGYARLYGFARFYPMPRPPIYNDLNISCKIEYKEVN